MKIGRVIATVVSTRKNDRVVGHKLLLVEPLYGPKDDWFVAADSVGAGIGELVLVTFDQPASLALIREAAIDAVVIGIVDAEPVIGK